MSRSAPLRDSSAVRGSARDEILNATLRVIANEGVDAVTHRRVAALAGVSPGSTTHHFSGREALLREAFVHYLEGADRMFAALFDAAESSETVSLGIVEQVLTSMIEREFAEPSLLRAEYELILFASKDEVLGGVLMAWEARLAGALAAVLEQAGVRRPTEAARTLVNFVRGFELERLVKPKLSEADFQRRLRPLLSALCGDNGR